MKPTLYKTTLDLGKVDAEMIGEKRNQVTIEIELRGTLRAGTRELTSYGKQPDDLTLSICGNIWNKRHSDIISGGQNYDYILEVLPDHPLAHEIVGVWKRWHLNDMKAGCEHQRDWPTSKELTIYEYARSSEGTNERRAAKDRAISAALRDEVAGLSAKEKDALTREYFVKSDRPRSRRDTATIKQRRRPRAGSNRMNTQRDCSGRLATLAAINTAPPGSMKHYRARSSLKLWAGKGGSNNGHDHASASDRVYGQSGRSGRLDRLDSGTDTRRGTGRRRIRRRRDLGEHTGEL
jgi:hypothetical protein